MQDFSYRSFTLIKLRHKTSPPKQTINTTMLDVYLDGRRLLCLFVYFLNYVINEPVRFEYLVMDVDIKTEAKFYYGWLIWPYLKTDLKLNLQVEITNSRREMRLRFYGKIGRKVIWCISHIHVLRKQRNISIHAHAHVHAYAHRQTHTHTHTHTSLMRFLDCYIITNIPAAAARRGSSDGASRDNRRSPILVIRGSLHNTEEPINYLGNPLILINCKVSQDQGNTTGHETSPYSPASKCWCEAIHYTDQGFYTGLDDGSLPNCF